MHRPRRRHSAHQTSSLDRPAPPRGNAAHALFRFGLFEVTCLAVQWYKPHMPKRFRSFFWRAFRQVVPDGRPVFLIWVIMMLLIANAIIALSRW
jgi:hypothetical protein